MTLKKQGKIRAIGASNVTEEDIREYCQYGQLDVIQEKYSIVTRKVEKRIVASMQGTWCVNTGVFSTGTRFTYR